MQLFFIHFFCGLVLGYLLFKEYVFTSFLVNRIQASNSLINFIMKMAIFLSLCAMSIFIFKNLVLLYFPLKNENISGVLAGLILVFFFVTLWDKKNFYKPTARNWVGYILPFMQGNYSGISVQIMGMPMQKKDNSLRLYEEESYELAEFLGGEINEINFNDIIMYGFSGVVETKSVPPYKIKIDISESYEASKNITYEKFFSDLLNAIINAYKNNKIKV